MSSGRGEVIRLQRVDAHHHLWDTGRRDYPWMDGNWADPLRGVFGTDELAEVTAPHQITTTVVVQAVSAVDETRELLAAAANSDQIGGVVGWIDLTSDDIADRLAALRDGLGGDRLVGIRHQVEDEPDPRWLLRDDVLRGLRTVGAAGLVYDLLVKGRDLAAAIELTGLLPQVSFVLDHLAKPDIAGGDAFEPWASSMWALAGRPNVTAKISGLVTEADWTSWTPEQLSPYIRHAVQVFGPDRLMFGSDWPVCTLAGSYARVLDATEKALGGLSPAELMAIFAGTAARVYRL